MSSLSFQAQGNYFYERRYQLDIIAFGKKTGVTYGNDSANGALMRIAFEIERSFTSGSDKGKIIIYNLSPKNRSSIQRGATMRLRAGYRGRVGNLFTGFVRKVTTEQAGPDVVTTAEVGDGEPSITYGTVNRSYNEAVSLAQVLQDIAGDLQLEIGGNVQSVGPGVIKGIPDYYFPLGLMLEGSVRKCLDQLLAHREMDWAVQNNKLVILPRGGVQYVTAVVLSKKTGMIGVPAFTEKYLKVSSLMNHQLIPGAYVLVDSDNKRVSGYYRLASCKYHGDTHEAPWTVECEGELLKTPLPFIPTAQGANLQTAVLP